MTMILSLKTRVWISYLVLAFFIFLLFPSPFYGLPAPGVDNSWGIALHLAFKYHLTFGKDIVYTYGPLGTLWHGLPIYISKFTYIGFDLYFMVVSFWGLRGFIQKNFRPAPLIFMLICILITGSMGTDQWVFFLLLFFLFSFLHEPRKTSYIIHAALISAFCLYVKVNSGVVAIFIFLAALHYALFVKKLNIRSYLAVFFSYIILLFVSAWLLNTWLPGYIIGSLQYIKDYGDVMYLPLGGKFGEVAGWGAVIIWVIYIITCLLFLITLIRKRQLLPYLDTIFIHIITGLSVFMWYRSSFIRADGHVYIFFNTIGLLALLLYIFTPRDLGKRTISIGCWAILCSTFAVISILNITAQDKTPLYSKIIKLSMIPAKINDIKGYFSAYTTYDKAMAQSDSLTALPNKFKGITGNHSADIIPTEVSIIYFNGLRYNPRPIFQSYAAHNKYLDELNYNKYMSATAPDYVFFNYEYSNERFAWADEARVKMALLSRYTFSDTIMDLVALKKKDIPRNLVKVKEDTIQVKLGEDIPVNKSNRLQFTRFFVDYDLGGKLKSFFYQPPPLTMTLRLESGKSRTYRALRPVMADGMILNKYVDDTQEFELFMLSDGCMNENVESIRIEPATPGGYQKNIKMINTWYQIDNKSETQRIADSVSIMQLVNGQNILKPLFQVPPDADADAIQSGLLTFHDNNNFVRLSGWGLRKGDNNDSTVVKALVKSGEKIYELPSGPATSGDLPGPIQGRKNLAGIVFKSIVSKSQLPDGVYQLGIAVYNNQTKNSSVRWTDNYIHVNYEYQLTKIPPPGPGQADSKKIKYNIETIKETRDGGGILVEGWAVMPDADSKTITNLVLQNREVSYRINTDLTRRPDVQAEFKKPFFEFSGFTILIPTAGLPKGIFTIGIEKAYPDGKNRCLVFTDKTLKIGFPDFIIPARINNLPPVKDFNGNIDVLKDDSNVVDLEGWAINEMDMVNQNSIDIVLKAGSVLYTAAAEHTSRADITAAFKNGLDLNNAGFAVKISKNELPKGKYEIGIHIYQKGKPGAVKLTGRFIMKE